MEGLSFGDLMNAIADPEHAAGDSAGKDKRPRRQSGLASEP